MDNLPTLHPETLGSDEVARVNEVISPLVRLGDSVIYVQVTFITMLAVSAISANAIMMFTIARSRRLHTISNMLILNLAFSDLMAAIVVLPTWAVTSLFQSLVFHHNVCIFLGTVTSLLFLESIAALTCIAVDRYIHICHPLRYVDIVSRQRAAITVLLTWISSLLLALLPIMHFGHYDFHPTSLAICTLDYLSSIPYTAVLLCFGILPHCLVICFCYCVIFKTARDQARKINAMHPVEVRIFPTGFSGSVSENHLSPWALPSDYGNRTQHWVEKVKTRQNVMFRKRAGSSIDARVSLEISGDLPRISVSAPSSPLRQSPAPSTEQRRSDINTEALWWRATKIVKKSISRTRAVKTVLTIIGFFLICWLPYITLIIYQISRHTPPGHAAEFITTFLAFSNSLANPIICTCVNREYRRALKQSFTNQKEALLRMAVAAFMDHQREPQADTSLDNQHRRSTQSDIVSETSDMALVRKLYDNYLQRHKDRCQITNNLSDS